MTQATVTVTNYGASITLDCDPCAIHETRHKWREALNDAQTHNRLEHGKSAA